MKKIIIILAVCAILAVIVVIGLNFLKIGPFSDDTEANSDQAIIPLKSLFIDMKPLIIPIIYGNEVAANLRLKIKLETKFQEDNKEYQGSLRDKKSENLKSAQTGVEKLLPHIENIFITDLHSFIPRFFKRYDRVDNKILSERLLIIATRKLQKKIIYSIEVNSKIVPIE